jgi:hypothetical protein
VRPQRLRRAASRRPATPRASRLGAAITVSVKPSPPHFR